MLENAVTLLECAGTSAAIIIEAIIIIAPFYMAMSLCKSNKKSVK